MELTLALDAGPASVASPDAKAPGTDPNDAASVAFASLLASLVAAVAPPPDLGPAVTDGAPDAVPDAVAAEAAPLGAVVPALAFDAPIALPPAPAPAAEVPVVPEPEPEPDRTEPEPELAPTRFSLPPTDAAAEAAEPVDHDPEVVAPKPKQEVATAPVRPASTTSTSVAELAITAPVAPSTSTSSDGGPSDRPDPRPAAITTTPAAPAPAVVPFREVLKPEIVSGPGAPPSPVEQVVKAVAPLRRLADGTHNIVLELHPAELGAVRVELSLDRGMVHLGLRADVEGTGQLLRAALPELRSQLDAAGLTAGRVAVDTGQAGRQGAGRSGWQADPDGRRRPAADEAEVPDDVASAYSTAAYGHVDVRL